jgi:Tol biopolymer transport system component
MKIVRWFVLFMVITLLAATQNLAGATTLSVPAVPPAEKIQRVSVASDGTQGDGYSQGSAISEDGRFVAFVSPASNLVANDTNGVQDVFVKDRSTGTIERVSLTSNGAQANLASVSVAISGDGRFVAFSSSASNLVANDNNGAQDVFVRDLQAGTTERVSVTSAGVAANGNCYHPSISKDGRFVGFDAEASNLYVGDTNAGGDVFIFDRQTRTLELISVSTSGGTANSYSYDPIMSADGQMVAFHSNATNLVSGSAGSEHVLCIYLRNRQTGTTMPITYGADALSWGPSISADGRFIVFWSNATNLVSGDTNAKSDAFLFDVEAAKIERVSVASDGTQGNNNSFFPVISADGRFVAYYSDATNLVSDDTNAVADVFMYDRLTHQTQLVSLTSGGLQGNGASQFPAISGNGRFVAFESNASNLVSEDTNGATDIFVRIVPKINVYVPAISR